MLISHRYGKRALPTRIIAREYEVLQKELNSNRHFDECDLNYTSDENMSRKVISKNLFEDCYELDNNEIPYRYKLKQMDIIIPDYNEKVYRFFFWYFEFVLQKWHFMFGI